LAALLFASTAFLWPQPASADIPWGAGCLPVAAAPDRTAASCGASLVDGEAIPPAEAPMAVKQVIRAADEIATAPTSGAVGTAAGSAVATTAPGRWATPSIALDCSR